MFNPGIQPGATLDNARLVGIFGCGTQGGMRRSHRTNTLLITSGHIDVVYEDRWIEDILHYTGMGLKGDQSLTSQNKTLAESKSTGVDVHLFEVHQEGEYTYVGRVQLTGDPYQEKQLDVEGVPRNVWIFPLRVANEVPPIPQAMFSEEEARRAKRAQQLGDNEIAKRAASAPSQPGQRAVQSHQLERNPYVAEHAKRRANGRCDLCGTAAPFVDAQNRPYLETHHIVWLSRGGPDSIDNTVALCPNCHRRVHILDRPQDLARLQRRATVM